MMARNMVGNGIIQIFKAVGIQQFVSQLADDIVEC
jgi:hypothetical protein